MPTEVHVLTDEQEQEMMRIQNEVQRLNDEITKHLRDVTVHKLEAWVDDADSIMNRLDYMAQDLALAEDGAEEGGSE